PAKDLLAVCEHALRVFGNLVLPLFTRRRLLDFRRTRFLECDDPVFTAPARLYVLTMTPVVDALRRSFSCLISSQLE
ncbi:MAG: hypothetical protein ACREUC_18470, partial [Steroidobacteraceae bacterium]